MLDVYLYKNWLCFLKIFFYNIVYTEDLKIEWAAKPFKFGSTLFNDTIIKLNHGCKYYNIKYISIMFIFYLKNKYFWLKKSIECLCGVVVKIFIVPLMYLELSPHHCYIIHRNIINYLPIFHHSSKLFV